MGAGWSAKGWLLSNTPNGVSVSLVVVIRRVHVRRVEIQVVGVVTIVRRRRPIVPVATLIVHAAGVIVVATENKRQRGGKPKESTNY